MAESECHAHIAIIQTAQELAMPTTERLSDIRDSVAKFHLYHYMRSDLDYAYQRPARIHIQLALVTPEDEAGRDLLNASQRADADAYESLLDCATEVRMGHAIDEQAWKDLWAQE